MDGTGIFEMDGIEFLETPVIRNGFPIAADPVGDLLRAIREKNYSRSYALLKKLDKPLCGQEAGEHLSAALHCSPKLFRAVLEHCKPGEYAATEQWKLPVLNTRYVNLTGTILTLAAAMNKPAHISILLRRGWDVNSASPASAQALLSLGWNCIGFDNTQQSRLIFGAAEYNSYQKTIPRPSWTIEGCTPLAAAIACGSVDAMRLLLRQKGVQKETSRAVCAAALTALHEGLEQRECVQAAFQLKSELFDGAGMRRELLRSGAPEPATVAKFSGLCDFTERLKAVRCTREQLRAAVEVLAEDFCGKREKKLLRMLSLYPELAEEQSIRDTLLSFYLCWTGGERTSTELLRAWQKACGEVRDISGMATFHLGQSTKVAECRKIFAALGEGGVLCAASESAWLEAWNDRPHMSVLTEYVRFYRTAAEGISHLAVLILDQHDPKFLREMLGRGVLSDEPRDEMLAYIAGKANAPMLRAVLLAAPACQSDCDTREPTPADGLFWSTRLDRMGEEERRAWAREAWERRLNADACRERMDAVHRMIRCHPLNRPFGVFGQTLWQEELDGMAFNSLNTAACCGRNPELLRALLERERAGRKLLTRDTLSWQDEENNRFPPENLNGTLLCLAAAAGRTEQVRLLLDAGYDPNEADMPCRSTYSGCEPLRETTVVTPLYMALKKGYTETARLLRERGGVAWPTREEEKNGCA